MREQRVKVTASAVAELSAAVVSACPAPPIPVRALYIPIHPVKKGGIVNGQVSFLAFLPGQQKHTNPTKNTWNVGLL
jgi:hypothetical protein